jgi:hypothetical protein
MLNKYNTDKLNCMGRIKILLKYCILVCLFIGFFTSIIQTNTQITLRVEGSHNISNDGTINEFGDIYFTTLGNPKQESRSGFNWMNASSEDDGENETMWGEIVGIGDIRYEEMVEGPATCEGWIWDPCLGFKASSEEEDSFTSGGSTVYKNHQWTILDYFNPQMRNLSKYGHTKLNYPPLDSTAIVYKDSGTNYNFWPHDSPAAKREVRFQLNAESIDRYEDIIATPAVTCSGDYQCRPKAAINTDDYAGLGLFVVIVPANDYFVSSIKLIPPGSDPDFEKAPYIEITSIASSSDPRCDNTSCRFDFDDNFFSSSCENNLGWLDVGNYTSYREGYGCTAEPNVPINAKIDDLGDLKPLLAYPITKDSAFYTQWSKTPDFDHTNLKIENSTVNVWTQIFTFLTSPNSFENFDTNTNPSPENNPPSFKDTMTQLTATANKQDNKKFSHYSFKKNIGSIENPTWNTDIFHRGEMPVVVGFAAKLSGGEEWDFGNTMPPPKIAQHDGETHRIASYNDVAYTLLVSFRQIGHKINVVPTCNVTTSSCDHSVLKYLMVDDNLNLTSQPNRKINHPDPKYTKRQHQTLIFGGQHSSHIAEKAHACITDIAHDMIVTSKNLDAKPVGIPVTYNATSTFSDLNNVLGINVAINPTTNLFPLSLNENSKFNIKVTGNVDHIFTVSYFDADLNFNIPNSGEGALTYLGDYALTTNVLDTNTTVKHKFLDMFPVDSVRNQSVVAYAPNANTNSRNYTCGFPYSIHRFNITPATDHYINEIDYNNNTTRVFIPSGNAADEYVYYSEPADAKPIRYTSSPLDIVIQMVGTSQNAQTLDVSFKPYPTLSVENLTDDDNFIVNSEPIKDPYGPNPVAPVENDTTVPNAVIEIDIFKTLKCLSIFDASDSSLIPFVTFSNDPDASCERINQKGTINAADIIPLPEPGLSIENTSKQFKLEYRTDTTQFNPPDHPYLLKMASITNNIQVYMEFSDYLYFVDGIVSSNIVTSRPALSIDKFIEDNLLIPKNKGLSAKKLSHTDILRTPNVITRNARLNLDILLTDQAAATQVNRYSHYIYDIYQFNYPTPSTTVIEPSMVQTLTSDQLNILKQTGHDYVNYPNFVSPKITTLNAQIYIALEEYKFMEFKFDLGSVSGTLAEVEFEVTDGSNTTSNAKEIHDSIFQNNEYTYRITPNSVMSGPSNQFPVGFRRYDTAEIKIYPSLGKDLKSVTVNYDINNDTQFDGNDKFVTYNVSNLTWESNTSPILKLFHHYSIDIPNVSRNVQVEFEFKKQSLLEFFGW